MATLDEIQDCFENIDIGEVAKMSIMDTKEEFLRLQKEQLWNGINSKGENITPPYTEMTIEIKERKGQPSERVTLNDTGDYYEGMYLDIVDNELVVMNHDAEGVVPSVEKSVSVDSTMPVSLQLLAKYGDDVLGLDEVSQQQYVDNALIDAMRENFTEKLENEL